MYRYNLRAYHGVDKLNIKVTKSRKLDTAQKVSLKPNIDVTLFPMSVEVGVRCNNSKCFSKKILCVEISKYNKYRKIV